MENVATQHTVQFVKESLTDNQTKIFHIGDGDSNLSQELTAIGFQVTTADLFEYEAGEPFDAVLFTQSLHRFESLEKTLVKAKALLNSSGKILFEDSALDLVDEKTSKWFYSVRELTSTLAGTTVNRDLEETKSVHSEKEIANALERHVGSFYSATCPYLYRYFEKDLAALPNGSATLKKILDWERTLIQEKSIQPIGIRRVAKQYFSYLK